MVSAEQQATLVGCGLVHRPGLQLMGDKGVVVSGVCSEGQRLLRGNRRRHMAFWQRPLLVEILSAHSYFYS